MKRLHRKAIGVAAAIGAASLLLAGCATDSGGSSGGSTSGGSVDISSYQEATTEAMQGVTTWEGPTVAYTPPANQNIALITCASVLQGCLQPAEYTAQAAKDLGWTSTIYDGKGDPATQNQLILQAVTQGVDAIVTFSVDPSYIATGLAAAKAANIPVASTQQGVPPADDGFVFDVGANWQRVGEIQGNWVVADSDGKATFLPMIDRAYASVVASSEKASETATTCSSCTVLPFQEFSGADVGNGLGTRVAGLVRQNPAINYVLGTYDPAAVDISVGLANAGMTAQTKTIGQIGIAAAIDAIKGGTMAATVAFDQQYTGYATIDQIGRLLAGQPLIVEEGVDESYAYGENVPMQLITSENVDSVDSTEGYQADIDTVANFHKLWGLD